MSEESDQFWRDLAAPLPSFEALVKSFRGYPEFDPSQDRDESGRWGGGGDSGDSGDGAKPADAKHPGEGYSKQAWVDSKGVIHTSNVNDAARALYEKKKVELKQPKQVSTLIQALGKEAKRMQAEGKQAPTFNLCDVSVKGTNLFCAESKGIPRVQMPQMDDQQTKDFRQWLKDKGYKVKKDDERAAHLRATQNELNGAKVAAVMEHLKGKPDNQSKRLIISQDDYILDGHHHWAGKLGLDAADGNLTNDTKMKIARVNVSIIKLLELAETFTGGKGKKPASEGTFGKSGLDLLGEVIVSAIEEYHIKREKLRGYPEFDPSEERDEQGHWIGGGGGAGSEGGFEFVSPNVSNIGLAVAHNALGGERQKALAQASGEIDRALGIASEDHHIIGAWKDGAENSLMSVSRGTGWDKLRVSGAMKGWLGDQKQVLLFRDQKDGSAALYKWDAKGDVQEIHDKLLGQGLAFHTLEPHKGGATVYVADLDGSLHDAVDKASGSADVEYRLGQAEFIGTQSETGSDREQRDDARRAYEQIISQSPVQASKAAWDRFRNRWGEALTKPHPLTADSIMAEAPPAKRNSLAVSDVAKQLNARAGHFLQQEFGKSSIEKSSPETDEYLSDAITEDLKAALTNGHSSPTWYSDTMTAAMKIAERMHPEIATNQDKRFAYIAGMAITSQGEIVDSNVRLAEDAYANFSRTGKFPTDMKVKNSGINVNMEKMNQLVTRFGLKGTREFFNKEMTVRQLKEITGIKVGRSGMDDVVNGSAVLGPKIGLGFYQNLTGNFKPLTMDMWFMRAWGRMTNTGIGQPDMEPIAERLRNALTEEGKKSPTSMEALHKIADEVFTQHERDFVKHGDEYKSGARSKSELVYASERFVDSYDGKMVEAPRGAEQRSFITGVFTRALDKLQSRYGITLEPAAAQATWWNPEKVLYEHLGGRTKDVATDYEKSLRKYEETHGPEPLAAAA